MAKKKASARRTRRVHSATFKARVALAALREDKTRRWQSYRLKEAKERTASKAKARTPATRKTR